MVNRVLLCIVLSVSLIGCIPASQQEVRDLTTAVDTIVPAVRELVSTESKDTKDKIEIILGQVEDINKEVATAEDPIDAVRKGWDASKDFNPYYGYGVLALGILEMFRRKKQSDGALSDVVKGVEKLSTGADKKTAFANSSAVTKTKVANIKATL